MAPPLSIIIPTLNEARNLPSLLRALAPARARGAEVLVVDGGSEDETVALAEGLGVTVLRAEGPTQRTYRSRFTSRYSC